MRLRSRIIEGEWEPGGKLPRETALADEYAVSRLTLRQALGLLADEGMVRREEGRGTFVAAGVPTLIHDLSLPSSLSGRPRGEGHSMTRRILTLELRGHLPARVSRALGVNEPGVCVRRLIDMDGTVASLDESWLPSSLARGLEDASLVDGSLSLTLDRQYGLRPSRAEHVVQSVAATHEEAELLDTCHAAPLSAVTSTMYLPDDRPFQWSRTAWLGERVPFHYRMTYEDVAASHQSRKS